MSNSVAKVIELTAASPKSIEDAVETGIAQGRGAEDDRHRAHLHRLRGQRAPRRTIRFAME